MHLWLAIFPSSDVAHQGHQLHLFPDLNLLVLLLLDFEEPECDPLERTDGCQVRTRKLLLRGKAEKAGDDFLPRFEDNGKCLVRAVLYELRLHGVSAPFRRESAN